MQPIKLQPFGYSEFYEWENPQTTTFARFVTFSKNNPNKIVPFGADPNGFLLGVTTINSLIDSDDNDVWHNKFKKNEVGDYLIEKERLAVGSKIYDENLEISLIKTFPWEHMIQIPTDEYDETKNYVPRSKRTEWVRVNLIGKCIVFDNGTCTPGQYCTPYTGKLKGKQGSAIPATEDSKHKFYVLERISDTTILIVNK